MVDVGKLGIEDEYETGKPCKKSRPFSRVQTGANRLAWICAFLIAVAVARLINHAALP